MRPLEGMGPLHDPVTWYGINYAGTQITQRDFQNKEKSGWTGTSSFVLEVPLRYLRPTTIYSVPCDRMVQRGYWPLELAVLVSVDRGKPLKSPRDPRSKDKTPKKLYIKMKSRPIFEPGPH